MACNQQSKGGMTKITLESRSNEMEDSLFGDLNVAIADKLTECLDDSLSTGLASLPMLKNEAALRSLLHHKYLKNIDIMEVYCDRNIFSTALFPAAQRRDIAKYFLAREVPKMAEKTHNMDTSETSTTSFPSMEQVPSEEDLLKLQDEIVDLQKRLRTQKQVCVQKSSQIADLKVAQSVASAATAILPSVTDKLAPAIQETLKSTQQLLELHSQGRSVAEKMETMSNESPNPDVENIVNLSTKRPKTAQERFEDEHSRLKGWQELSDLF